MISRTLFFVIILLKIDILQSQITGEYDQIVATEPDHVDVKYFPSYIQNDVYLTILYKCQLGSRRRVSLSIRIDLNDVRRNFIVFRRHWFCSGLMQTQVRYILVRLPLPLAYGSDQQSKLVSWPIEHGILTIDMYRTELPIDNEILKSVRFNIRFLPVDQRAKFRSFPWRPIVKEKPLIEVCPREPETVEIIRYPLVLTGKQYGKHFVLPNYKTQLFRFEQQQRLKRAKFSLVFWLYVEEYCSPTTTATHCGILQHLTFNNSHLTPELFFNRDGQISVNTFDYAHDLFGSRAKTLASLPKRDWCRLAFVVDERQWRIYINCLENWDKPIVAIHYSQLNYYYSDQLGTFIVGGTDFNPSFQGFVTELTFYRRVALTYEQLPKKRPNFEIDRWPRIFSRTNQCQAARELFDDCVDQFRRFQRNHLQKTTCSANIFLKEKPISQSLLIRTWKRQLLNSSAVDVRYRIFRSLYRKVLDKSVDVGKKLFDLTIKLFMADDPEKTCRRALLWLEQAACYNYPQAYSLLGTLHQFGLCGLQANQTRAIEFLFTGALLHDRLSLLALGHRHMYGFSDVPVDDDAAYVYYREIADKAREEHYNPIADEVSMDLVRLTDEETIEDLVFDASDSFYWLRQQALRGVAAAQHHLGALMYAGRQGLTRNVQAAVEYFRLGAAQHDPSSHYGYGLALLKGQGTQKNLTGAVHHLEQAVEHGFSGAQVALGYYAYEIERNFTRAAHYWQLCFNETHDMHCAHNLGVMWTSGHYPPSFQVDHVKAWEYYSYAAQKGQIDSKIVVSFYNARHGHPVIVRNPWIAALWSRLVAEETSALGTVVRRGLEAYRDHRWQTSFLFYLQAAFAGTELGYFNAGYLCKEFHIRHGSELNCVDDLLQISLVLSENFRTRDPYAILTVAEYFQAKEKNTSRVAQLYFDLFRGGDPQGLFKLAELEEISEPNDRVAPYIWTSIGIEFDSENVYRRLQRIYQFCRNLTTEKSKESYIPCTLAYFRVSFLLYFNETIPIFILLTILLFTIVFLFFIRI